MRRHSAEWFRERALERRAWVAGRRNSLKNSLHRDLEELEALKVELLRKARAERRKNSRND